MSSWRRAVRGFSTRLYLQAQTGSKWKESTLAWPSNRLLPADKIRRRVFWVPLVRDQQAGCQYKRESITTRVERHRLPSILAGRRCASHIDVHCPCREEGVIMTGYLKSSQNID